MKGRVFGKILVTAVTVVSLAAVLPTFFIFQYLLLNSYLLVLAAAVAAAAMATVLYTGPARVVHLVAASYVAGWWVLAGVSRPDLPRLPGGPGDGPAAPVVAVDAVPDGVTPLLTVGTETAEEGPPDRTAGPSPRTGTCVWSEEVESVPLCGAAVPAAAERTYGDGADGIVREYSFPGDRPLRLVVFRLPAPGDVAEKTSRELLVRRVAAEYRFDDGPLVVVVPSPLSLFSGLPAAFAFRSRTSPAPGGEGLLPGRNVYVFTKNVTLAGRPA